MRFSSSFGFWFSVLGFRIWKGGLRFLVDLQALLTSYRVERTSVHMCGEWNDDMWLIIVNFYGIFMCDCIRGVLWNTLKWMC